MYTHNYVKILDMIRFTNEPMQEILPLLQSQLKENDICTFDVINPDIFEDYAGNEIVIEGEHYIGRGFKTWTDLAELLHCKMLIPQISDYPFVTLRYKKLNNDSFHTDPKTTEKYGLNSHFARIHKMEEPAFLYYYIQALNNVKVQNRTQILNLGINKGDEFTVIKNLLDIKEYKKLNLVGIDHSKSAIDYTTECFKEDNATFYTHDINRLDDLKLGEFDLLISIGTLQSPSIDFKPFFMHLVQNYLKKDSAIILGFPNSRWIGGEMVYGAKAPNYAMSEMSLLFNDVIFCKKYLQQKKYRVTVTGKHYIFLTATKIG